MLLNVGRDNHGLDLVEVANAARLAPAEELRGGLDVCGARVAVPDVSREEFDEAPNGILAGVRDRRWEGFDAGAVEIVGCWYGDDFLAHKSVVIGTSIRALFQSGAVRGTVGIPAFGPFLKSHDPGRPGTALLDGPLGQR